MSPKPLVCLALALAAPLGFAQQAASAPSRPAAYRAEFTLTETQPGKPATVHSYTLLLQADGGSRNQIEVGGRVPVRTAADQYTYESTGVSLDCSLSRPPLAGDELGLIIRMSVTSATPTANPYLPDFHSAISSVATAIPLRQRVVVSKFSDPESNTSYELQLYAEPAPPPGR